MAQELDFDKLVELHYQSLYRFALSLTRNESEACDLTQQSFFILAKHSAQLRDAQKAKSWLFTTLHREFLGRKRKMIRFPEIDVSGAEQELPPVEASPQEADGTVALRALAQIDPIFQSAVSLFYLEDYSYAEIAEILETPLGTVKSRIARGIAQLQKLLVEAPKAEGGRP